MTSHNLRAASTHDAMYLDFGAFANWDTKGLEALRLHPEYRSLSTAHQSQLVLKLPAMRPALPFNSHWIFILDQAMLCASYTNSSQKLLKSRASCSLPLRRTSITHLRRPLPVRVEDWTSSIRMSDATINPELAKRARATSSARTSRRETALHEPLLLRQRITINEIRNRGIQHV